MDPHEIKNESLATAVLGAALQSQEGACALASVKADLFTGSKCRAFLKVIKKLVQADAPVDFNSVPDALAQLGCFDSDHTGGPKTWSLEQLFDAESRAPHEKQLTHHIGSLEALREQRELLWFGKNLVRQAGEKILSRDDLSALRSSTEQAVFSLAYQSEGRTGPESIGPVVQRVYDELTARHEGRETQGSPIPTGFRDLDKALDGGFRRGQLVVVCGRPGHGKTSQCLGLAQNMAAQGPVLVFSLEMGAAELGCRLLARESAVPLRNLRTCYLSSRHWEHITETLGRISDTSLFIDDNPDLTPARVLSASMAVAVKAKQPLAALIIDYLGLMATDERCATEALRIASITRSLKIAAKRLNVPIILAAQLNRNVEARLDKSPQLSDLRDSGAIEQDCDIALGMFRPWLYSPEKQDEGTAHALILKHRNGRIGKVDLAWHPATASFRDAPADVPRLAVL